MPREPRAILTAAALAATVLGAGVAALPAVAAGPSSRLAGRVPQATHQFCRSMHLPTTGALTPATYGAVGDGSHDDTAALQAALNAASATRPLVLPAGRVFAHTGVLHLRVPGEVVEGGGTLLATDPATSSVWVEADDVSLFGVTLATTGVTQRWSAWEQMGLRLDGHTGATVCGVTVTGSAAAGVYVGGADHFLLSGVTVRGSQADGIHITDGSYDGQVVAPTTVATGDDGVSVVSYAADGTACHDITVQRAHVEGTTGGRGLSVVGGTRITETDFEVDRSAAAGVYVAAEGDPWYSAAPIDVSFSRGRIVGANTDPTIDHGSILVLSGESDVAPSGVTVSGVSILDSRATASRDVGVIDYGAAPTDVVLSGISIVGGPPTAYEGNAPAGSFTTLGWTLDGTPLPNQG